MKDFEIVYMDGYDEVRNSDTQEVVFSTVLPDYITKWEIGRTVMDEKVVDNIVRIWNKTGKSSGNLWSDGDLDEYLLNEGDCTQEEREIIVESLYQHAKNLKP